MRLPEMTSRPARRISWADLFSHMFNISVTVLYAVIFATPLLGMVAAIEPAL